MDARDYRKELIELGNFISSKEQIEDKIKQLEDESWELEKKIKNLKTEYDKEQSDVSGLEKMGFSKFFFEMINKYDKKMEKEKKEALAALAKYEAAKSEYESVNFELDKMRVELLKIDSVKRKYDEKYLSYNVYKKAIKNINSNEAKYVKEAIEIDGNEINFKKQAYEIATKIGNKEQIQLYKKQLDRSKNILKFHR